MDWRQQLALNLSSETEAYGYTLSIWGAGALLIHQFSSPNIVEVYAYLGGALLGFVALALLAFRQLFSRERVGDEKQLVVASMLHVFATIGNLALSHVLIGALLPVFAVPSTPAFLLVGFQVTVAYNLLLLVETSLARATANLERTLSR